MAGTIIYRLFGPGLTGNIVRARAKEMFYELDTDGSGGLTPDELQDWFERYIYSIVQHVIDKIVLIHTHFLVVFVGHMCDVNEVTV